jgi:hypothetical protein
VAAVSVGAVDISATYQEVTGRGHTDVQRITFDIIGNVHEGAPTQNVMLDGVRVEVVGGPLDGRSTFTDAYGNFRLVGVPAAGFALKVKKPDYEDVQFNVVDLPRDAAPSIAMLPNAGQVSFVVTGIDVCTERPRDPYVGGMRTMGTFVAYHDGTVTASGSYPFYMNQSAWVYSVSPEGHVQHAGSPVRGAGVQITGGRRYFFAAGGDFDRCPGLPVPMPEGYRITVTHPR